MQRDSHSSPARSAGLLDAGLEFASLDLPPIAFGPIPSRRLGRSLGINNIPPKICSYSCLYCQVGPTTDRVFEPRDFYPPAQIVEEVAARVTEVRARGEPIDYLSFVPDGEPTLDAGLAETIHLLRPLGIDIAVMTNGSLLWRDDVRRALDTADWVSVKVDAATGSIWQKLNRPHPDVDLTTVQNGIRRFAEEFTGDLVSETMLISGINDHVASLDAIGAVLRSIRPDTAYLAIPTRPTPYPNITAPDEDIVNRGYQILSRYVLRVCLLSGYEGDEFPRRETRPPICWPSPRCTR